MGRSMGSEIVTEGKRVQEKMGAAMGHRVEVKMVRSDVLYMLKR